MKNNNKQLKKSQSIQLRDQLTAVNNLLEGKDNAFAMTLLTNPGMMSSARSIMFTNHLRQFVNLLNPHFPKLFTNYENIIGELSTSYKRAKNDLEVVVKVLKFNDYDASMQNYKVIVKDLETGKHQLIENTKYEDLTEKFGYRYNTSYLDSKQRGDIIPKNAVYHKSTSYDDFMNYCYGQNAIFMYMIDNRTIEDAILVSESFAKQMKSLEVETFRVSINDNDILCNVYGDNKNYKAFPDIGEEIKGGVVCATRRINNSQILFDLKQSNLQNIDYLNDHCTYAVGGRVENITVYSNKSIEDIPDNQFNHQIISYLKMQEEYYQSILDEADRILDEGGELGKSLRMEVRKAKDYMDPNTKWCEENRTPFNNMVVEFTVVREVGITEGQKITGKVCPFTW